MKNKSPRQIAIAEGRTTYNSGKPCRNGHIGKHYITGSCVECARIASDKNNKKYQSTNPPSIARKYKSLKRQEAKLSGKIRYNTSIPCRNGHISDRYVTTGECIECLKFHVPTKEAKKATSRRFKDRKKISDPTYFANQAAQYRRKYPFKARINKLFRTAQRHAKCDGVTLDFDVQYLADKLTESLNTSAITELPHSPRTASIDKIIASQPISRSNIQIVPFWYNMAKRDWIEGDLISAMADFGFVHTERGR